MLRLRSRLLSSRSNRLYVSSSPHLITPLSSYQYTSYSTNNSSCESFLTKARANANTIKSDSTRKVSTLVTPSILSTAAPTEYNNENAAHNNGVLFRSKSTMAAEDFSKNDGNIFPSLIIGANGKIEPLGTFAEAQAEVSSEMCVIYIHREKSTRLGVNHHNQIYILLYLVLIYSQHFTQFLKHE